jgi:catalase (peroxidase I)
MSWVFCSHSVLPAIAEIYAQADSGRRFIEDFVAAWVKVITTIVRFALMGPKPRQADPQRSACRDG